MEDHIMTDLRQRFIEDLQLQGKSQRTQQAYVRMVRLLAEYFNTPPDQFTEDQIRQYFLYVTNVKKWSGATITQALWAIKTFYTVTLQREWQILNLIRPHNAQKLPDVLSHDEVQRLLQAVRLPYYRMCLTTIYSCGLRLAVAEAVRKRPLAAATQLCQEVAVHLDRPDLTPANIRTAVEEVSCTVIRPVLQHQWEAGRFHPTEEVVLQEALAALLSSQPSASVPVTSDLRELGLEPAEAVEFQGSQRQQSAAIAVPLNPRVTVEQVSAKIRLMVVALTLYFWNVPLSRIALWFGGTKGTIHQWVIDLAVAVFPVIQAWIVQRVTTTLVTVDEKWLKIRKQWHYWFVTLDEATGLPVCMALLPTRTTWACCWVLVSLKHLGKVPRAVITDGLAGYAASVPVVFPRATHLGCLFHHQ
jgi:hypothetical protein